MTYPRRPTITGQPWFLRAALTAAAAAALAACGNGGEDSASGSTGIDSSDAAAPPGSAGANGAAGAAGSSGSGAPDDGAAGAPTTGSDGGGASGAGSSDPRSPAAADAGASDPGCSHSLTFEPCSGDATCRFVEECESGQCVCLDGSWACSSRNTCGAACGVPQQSTCGSPCTAEARDCLCTQGGGFDYVGCSCTGGVWECAGGGG